MGTPLEISRDDINATKLLDAGWYPCEVTSYEEKAAKTDGSLNRNLGFKVIDVADHAGVKLRTTFNSKFAPLLGPFIVAMGGKFELGFKTDMEKCVGRKVMVHVKRGVYNDNPTNEIDGFRAAA